MRPRVCVVLAFSLVACRTEPAARAGLAPRLAPIATDQFASMFVAIPHGSRVPIAVEQLRARCGDAAVCTASTRPPAPPATRWPELWIVARAPGTTEVVVDYLHPTRHTQVTERIAIEITPPPRYEDAAIGRPRPSGNAVVHQLAASALTRSVPADGRDPGVSIARCRAGSPEASRISGHDRADVRLFTCEAFVEVEPSVYRARTCAGSCAFGEGERYTLCIQTTGDTVTGARVLETGSRDARLQSKLSEGSFSAGACSPTGG